MSLSLIVQFPEVEPVELSLFTDGLCVSASVTVQTPLEEFLRSMVDVCSTCGGFDAGNIFVSLETDDSNFVLGVVDGFALSAFTVTERGTNGDVVRGLFVLELVILLDFPSISFESVAVVSESDESSS